MALATRPKPKVQHKKRRAQHHRQSKHYLKAYTPYLPMLAIVGAGIYANQHWPASLSGVSGLSANPPTTRIEAIAGSQNQWSLAFILAISTAAFAIFVFQHWYRVQRVLNRGEAFVVHHPWFDIVLVLIATVGVLLTRSNALIH